jgi:hypothetical protein
MQAILVRGGRIAPAALVPTDLERVSLYDGFIAYAGTYVVAGDRVSHNIDASWSSANEHSPTLSATTKQCGEERLVLRRFLQA